MNKKVIWIGMASALLIGGGVFWWMRTKNKAKAEAEAKKKAEEEADAKKKAEEEAAAKEKESSNKATQSTESTPKATFDSTPFKTKDEGNAFRKWVNEKHPDWRLNGDVLSPTGEFNNTTIRAAYKEFGASYQEELKKLAATTTDKKKEDELLAAKSRRKKFGELIYSKGWEGKKIRPIGGKDKTYETYYYDAAREEYVKDGGKNEVDGNKHLFSKYKKTGYSSRLGFWVLNLDKTNKFIIVDPEDFEAV
jgi:hypothetical protein